MWRKNLRKHDIFRIGGSHTYFVVINPCCTDAWWRKVLRFFGFKVFNPAGLTKVMPTIFIRLKNWEKK